MKYKYKRKEIILLIERDMQLLDIAIIGDGYEESDRRNYKERYHMLKNILDIVKEGK